jgi:hypothetical protein
VRIRPRTDEVRRRERQDGSGNGRLKGLKQRAVSTQRVRRPMCVPWRSRLKSPLRMLEIASDVTPGDPATVREPESRCRKSAES